MILFICILFWMIISHVVPVKGNFSNSLLTDSAFYSFICDHISDLSNCLGGIPSVKSWWLFLSVSLQADIVSLVSTKRKNLSHEHVVLTNRLIVCKQRLAQGDYSVVSGIVTLKLRLILNLLHCAPPSPSALLESAEIRSRAKWPDKGDEGSWFVLVSFHYFWSWWF